MLDVGKLLDLQTTVRVLFKMNLRLKFFWMQEDTDTHSLFAHLFSWNILLFFCNNSSIFSCLIFFTLWLFLWFTKISLKKIQLRDREQEKGRTSAIFYVLFWGSTLAFWLIQKCKHFIHFSLVSRWLLHPLLLIWHITFLSMEGKYKEYVRLLHETNHVSWEEQRPWVWIEWQMIQFSIFRVIDISTPSLILLEGNAHVLYSESPFLYIVL